jgi:HlyD family secretion protein
LTTWSDKINSDVSALLSAENSISSAKSAIVTLQKGTDPLDIQSQTLNLEQAQNSYNNAFTVAPFSGVFARADVNQGDTIGSGATVGIFISNQKIAEVSLNEVDVAKVKIGQKVNLTFDAIDGLNITGTVAEVDLVGTVAQGVVTYNVKIGFDTQDTRIKSGMSVSAGIITDVRQDVLTVPNGAIKAQGNTSTVSLVPAGNGQDGQTVALAIAPVLTQVEVGLSDDTNTEVTSGLKEGDLVVARTIAGSVASTQSAPSILSAATGGRGGAAAGAGRAFGR